MRIWVRSQDKKLLVEVNCFEINDYNNDIIGVCCNSNRDYILGSYSTKEKAFKVLDKIEACIINREILDHGINIPQDEEV